jgi:ABC-type antimicrobial peptide transport system permease subunit
VLTIVWQDFLYALRALARRPMYATVTVVVLAIAIGANTTVFSVLNEVTQRFGEIGVRLALGARTSDIVRLVLTQGGKLIALGSALGLIGAAGVGRVLASQLRTVSALDPAVLAGAVLALAGAALVASWLPARRAGNTDPMIALRAE